MSKSNRQVTITLNEWALSEIRSEAAKRHVSVSVLVNEYLLAMLLSGGTKQWVLRETAKG
jgi:hypothetical protein